MSKGTRSLVPGKSLMGFTLVLVLSGLLLTVSACENLTTGTSPTIGTVAEIATTTIPASTTTTAAQRPTPPSGSTTSESETSTGASEVPPGVPKAFWTRFEEDDSRLHWTGPWTDAPLLPGASESGFRFGAKNAAVSLRFEGTRVELVACPNPHAGQALVTLDGDAWFIVDLYSDPGSQGIIVWMSPVLAPGTHELEFRWADDRNPLSDASIINFDAVDVMGTLVD
jgi:hypothetical protein